MLWFEFFNETGQALMARRERRLYARLGTRRLPRRLRRLTQSGSRRRPVEGEHR